jgi:hypothetical protein
MSVVTKSWCRQTLNIIFLLGIGVLVEIIAHNHNARVDLTPSEKYSLSAQTIQVLKGLKRDVSFVVFYRAGNRAYYEEFFQRYQGYSPRIHYRLFHLDRHPAQAKLYGISNYGQTVVESGVKKEIVSFPTEERPDRGGIRSKERDRQFPHRGKGAQGHSQHH